MSVLNVYGTHTELHTRARIGKITTPSEIVKQGNQPGTKLRNDESISKEVHIEESLSEDEREAMEKLLIKYQGVFAINPRKPKQLNMSRRIITEDGRPVFQKPRRVPNLWCSEVDQQVEGMIANEIIRPSVTQYR